MYLLRISGAWLSGGSQRKLKSLVYGGVFGWLLLLGGYGQEAGYGIITGKLLEQGTGTPIAGATVTVRGTTLGGLTDATGTYRLTQVPSGNQTLVFTKSGFERSLRPDVRVASQQTTTIDTSLAPDYYEMETFEIIAEPFENQAVELLADRQSSSALLDSIGSDFFSKAGAGDAAEIMTKVTGASVVDGKYVYIRGLGERYSNTQLNSAMVPSADPDKKTVQMDIFPASAIEQVITTKTFTPEQPGSFTGGSVNIITKSFPESRFMNFSLGSSYNTRSSLNNGFITPPGGKTDFLGFDDGTRELPGEWSSFQDTDALVAATSGTGGRSDEERRANAEEVLRLTRAFSDDLTETTRKAPLNHNFSFSTGNKHLIFEKPFGYLVGISYDRKFNFYDNGIQRRYQNNRGLTLEPDYDVREVKGSEEVGWGTLINLAYEIYSGHQLKFNILYNRNSEDVARIQTGLRENVEPDIYEEHVLHFTARELQTYQLQGKHEIPQAKDWKIDWSASFAATTQDEPDLRRLGFQYNPDTGRARIRAAVYPEPTRYFREVSEDNRNFKLDNTIPFNQWNELESQVKFGIYYSKSEREYRERRFTYQSNSSPTYQDFVSEGNPDRFLDSENINYTAGSGNARYRFNKYIREEEKNEYDGQYEVVAGYGMIELPLFSKLRLVTGARYEATLIQVDSSLAGSGELKDTQVLPSLGLIYEIKKDMNLRLSYGRTLAQPTFREIAPGAYFDVANQFIVVGNPDLTTTLVDNYDLRWEWFPRPGEIYSASVFYKTLQDPIELEEVSANDQVQYTNRDKAMLYGIELEVRKGFDFIDESLKYFNSGLNFTYLKSEVTASLFEFEDGTRPLQGQSPYIFNADLTFDHPGWGTTASLFYNVFGERLALTSRITPSVYEQPVHSLDFTLSQKLGKNWKIKLSAKNLLDPEVEKSIKFRGEEYIYSSYRKGRTFGVGLSYDF